MTRPRRIVQRPDPTEPQGGEGAAKGAEHEWNDCTAATGAMLLDVESDGKVRVHGGDIRHHQNDMDKGIGLDDLAVAWRHYGYDLRDWSGRGWDDVKKARAEKRWLVLQGVGNVPGAGTTSVPHAILVGPETDLMGRWLIADPLVDKWQFVPPDKLRTWAQAFRSTVNFAVSKIPAAAPAPAPEVDVPDLTTYLPGYIATVRENASVRTAPSLTAQKLRGTAKPETWTVTGFVKGDAYQNSDQWITRWAGGRWEYTAGANLKGAPTAPVSSGYTQEQLDAAITAQKAADEVAKDAAVESAVDVERTRISGVLGL